MDLVQQMSLFQSKIENTLGRHGVPSDSAEAIAAEITDAFWRSDYCRADCYDLYHTVGEPSDAQPELTGPPPAWFVDAMLDKGGLIGSG